MNTQAIPRTQKYVTLVGESFSQQVKHRENCAYITSCRMIRILVRERSALATLIFTSRVCLSVIRSVILSFCLSVRNFGAKYLGNEAR